MNLRDILGHPGIPFFLLGLSLIINFSLYRRWSEMRRNRIFYEDRFQRLFDSNVIGFLISDLKGRVVAANDYYLNLLGVSRSEMRSGLSWADFTPPEYVEVSAKALREIEQFGVTTPFEKDYVRRDGTRVSVTVGAARAQNHIISYIINISDRKCAERELAEAKARLEDNVDIRTRELLDANRELSDTQIFLDSVIENIPNMIFVKDADELRFVRLNRAGEELLGHSRLDIIGKNDFDFFPADQAESFQEKDREVILGGCVVDIPEEPIKTKYGIRQLHTKKIPILDKNGKPLYLLGISEDITERIIAEEQRIELMRAQAARTAAERSNTRLEFLARASAALNESLDIRSLLNSFARVIVDHMADWCIVDLYDEKTEIVDRIVATAKHGHVPQEIVEWWQTHKLDNKSEQGVGFVVRTGKSRIYNDLSRQKLVEMFGGSEIVDKICQWEMCSSMIVPLSYHGKVLGTLCFIYTHTKQTYDDFDLSIAQDLAKRAALAIENASLYTKASEASRAKSAFLANISHEIRTPLGAMLGFAELVLDDSSLNSQQQAYISTIARNGRQLLRLVDEILDLSKVESDRIQIEQLSFSLPTLLSEVRSLMKIKANEKGLCLDFHGLDQLPARVKTDPLRLRQILFNVIGNALKFTEKGSITVTTVFKPEPKSNNRGALEILVADTGIGMDENQSAKIFQPFVQADGTMARKFGGTGLGLFLSRKLARLLGGDVILRQTQLGRGSEFAIHIAVEIDSVPVFKNIEPPGTKIEGAPAHIKVLLVDDSPDNRMLISAFLRRPGIELETADNGRRAVDKAMHSPFDLILMDIQMPEMDGFEAIHELSRRGYKGPVVALTAHAMKGDREKCLRAGFDGYLCKPVTRQSLLDVLNRYASPHEPLSSPVFR